MDCKRVHAGEFGDKCAIDHAMPLDPGLPSERLGHDIYPVMGLPFRSVAGVSLVMVRLVEHAQAFGGKSLG